MKFIQAFDIKLNLYLQSYLNTETEEEDGIQCLKLMVAQSPLVTKNCTRPVKFDLGQV